MSECVVQWVNFLGTSSKNYSCGSKFYRATYANSIADDSISSVTTYKLWINKSWRLDEAFQFIIITPTYTELADICSRKADIGDTLDCLLRMATVLVFVSSELVLLQFHSW